MLNNKSMVGSKIGISIPKYGLENIPAKVDTGADSSSIWASNIQETEGVLSFCLFGKSSPYYSGLQIRTKNYSLQRIKNSFGEAETRYKVRIPIKIADRAIRTRVTLADRSKNKFPVLIGKRTLQNRFVVDVSKSDYKESKKILVLGDKKLKSTENFMKEMGLQFATEIRIIVASYDQIKVSIDKTVNVNLLPDNSDLKDFDLIYFKDWANNSDIAAAIAKYAKNRGIPFMDSAVEKFPAVTKLHQCVILKDAEVQIPDTIYLASKYLPSSYEELSSKLGIPFVLKDNVGQKGQNNFLVDNIIEYQNISRTAEKNGIKLLAQKFVSNEGDYRMLVLNQRIRLAIRREAAGGSHLNNVSAGGRAELVKLNDLSKDMRHTAIRASKLLDIEVAGVDMIQDKITDNWYCLEVNYSPQIASGAFIKDKQQVVGNLFKNIARIG